MNSYYYITHVLHILASEEGKGEKGWREATEREEPKVFTNDIAFVENIRT